MSGRLNSGFCLRLFHCFAACTDVAEGLLLVGQAVRDGSVVRVPCHAAELKNILRVHYVPGSDSSTLELPGRGGKNALLVLWRTAARFDCAPPAFEPAIATCRPEPGRRAFAVSAETAGKPAALVSCVMLA